LLNEQKYASDYEADCLLGVFPTFMRYQTIVLLGILACAIGLGMIYALRPARPLAPPDRVCSAFRKQIGMAKAQWAADERKTTNDIAMAADLFGPTNYLREELRCPDSGRYILGRVGEPVTCSVHHSN
jgi:hypothetical protein